MKIQLTKELKIALLKAVESGELDTDILPSVKRDETKESIEEIAAEIIRLQKTSPNLKEEARLMMQYADGTITSEEWIKAYIELETNHTKTNEAE